MLRFMPTVAKKLMKPALFTNFIKFYCSEFTIDPFIEHHAQITMRQHRRLYLNRSVLNQNKDVIYAQLRKPNEGMIALKQLGKCPAVIQKLSGKAEDEVDIVLDGKRMRKLSKNGIFPLTPLYVRVEGREYRCVFNKIDFHPDGFIQKAYLKEYIPGEPNHLSIPIEVTHITSNPYVMRKGQFETHIEDLDVICYNEEYPMRIYVDISYCSPDRPYKVGDLANTLPPGLIVHPKINLNERIVTIIEEIKKDQASKQEAMKELMDKSKKSKEVKPGQTAAGGAGGQDAGKDKAAGGAGQATGGATAGKTSGAGSGSTTDKAKK